MCVTGVQPTSCVSWASCLHCMSPAHFAACHPPPHVSPIHLACILLTSFASSPPRVCHGCPAHLVCVVGILPPLHASCPLRCPLSPTSCESHPPCMRPTHRIYILPTSWASSPCVCYGCSAHLVHVVGILPPLHAS